MAKQSLKQKAVSSMIWTALPKYSMIVRSFVSYYSCQKKAALDFFQESFNKITEGRADYKLITQEILG